MSGALRQREIVDREQAVVVSPALLRLKARGARGFAVPDSALLQAVGFAALKLKLVVEPGGAAALAAVLSGTFDARGQTVAVVLSGGNIDPEMLVRCIDSITP